MTAILSCFISKPNSGVRHEPQQGQPYRNHFRQIRLVKKEIHRTDKNTLEIIKQRLAEGEDVLISGFGKFCVRGKSKRRGRNPANGSKLMLGARQVVTFRCSSILKEKLNGKG